MMLSKNQFPLFGIMLTGLANFLKISADYLR